MSEHWERIRAALAGERAAAVPVSLWRHFPEDDQRAETLAEATLAWQRQFGFDFVKLMPPGDYPVIAWGGASRYQGSPSGTRTVTHYPVQRVEDWEHLELVPVERGVLAEVVRTVRLVAQELGGAVPILQTIFSPLTVAMKLSNGLVLAHLAADPGAVEAGLAVISEVMRALVEASLAAGADGIFFATQCATAEVLDEAGYARWGKPWDLAVLAAARGQAVGAAERSSEPLLLLHLHGQQPHFDLLSDYPVQIVNWHDRRTGLSLAEGARRSGRCVAGGIDESRIAEMTPDEVAGQVRDAIAQLEGRRLLVTPGCVIPIHTPVPNVAAAVRAARVGVLGG